MVTITDLIHTVVKKLERFAISNSGGFGEYSDFDLILFVPSERYSADAKYTLILSNAIFDNRSQKENIVLVLDFLSKNLSLTEYKAISRVNILHSQDKFVMNVKFVFSFRQPVIEVINFSTGGVEIEYAILAKSLILDKFKEGRAVRLQTIEGKTIRAGLETIDDDFNLVYYTGKGLKEIWSDDLSAEEKIRAEELKGLPMRYLIDNHYVAKIPIEEIESIL